MNADEEISGMSTRRGRFENDQPSPIDLRFAETFLRALRDGHDPNAGGEPCSKGVANKRDVNVGLALKALLNVNRARGRKVLYDADVMLEVRRRRWPIEAHNSMATILPGLHIEPLESLRQSILAAADTLNLSKWRRTGLVGRITRKLRDKAVVEYFDSIVANFDHEEEQEMLYTLIAIQRELEPWGIRLELDPMRLGLVSLARRKYYN